MIEVTFAHGELYDHVPYRGRPIDVLYLIRMGRMTGQERAVAFHLTNHVRFTGRVFYDAPRGKAGTHYLLRNIVRDFDPARRLVDWRSATVEAPDTRGRESKLARDWKKGGRCRCVFSVRFTACS